MTNWIATGAWGLALAVAIGAFGAHGLRGRLDAYSLDIYERAVFYHFVHTLGILIVRGYDGGWFGAAFDRRVGVPIVDCRSGAVLGKSLPPGAHGKPHAGRDHSVWWNVVHRGLDRTGDLCLALASSGALTILPSRTAADKIAPPHWSGAVLGKSLRPGAYGKPHAGRDHSVWWNVVHRGLGSRRRSCRAERQATRSPAPLEWCCPREVSTSWRLRETACWARSLRLVEHRSSRPGSRRRSCRAQRQATRSPAPLGFPGSGLRCAGQLLKVIDGLAEPVFQFTLGSHPKMLRALDMSGCRLRGSSEGSGS